MFLWLKFLSNPKDFWIQHSFSIQNFFGTEIFLDLTFFRTQIFWTQIFWTQIFVRPQILLDPKFSWTQNFIGPTIFGPNFIGPEIFFSTQIFFDPIF